MAGSPKKKTAAAKGKTKTKASKATPPVSARPSLVDTPSADFEAGLLFERFGAGNMGRLDALSFQKMWRERDKLQQLRKALVPPNSANPGSLPPGVSSGVAPLYAVPPSGEGAGVPMSFEAGQLFERYDHDHDGRLTRPEFEGLLNDYLRSKQQQPPPSNHTTTTNNTPPAQPAPLPPPPQPLPPAEPPLAPRALPTEVTHYNESTGVPLPADVVLRYQSAYGHKVLPIAQAFERRMHTLQGLLTSHVLPRREQLVQLGRRVKVVEEEVRGARLAIERETVADSQAILERLRSAESLKLAALDHRMTQVVTEIDAIDRLLSKLQIGESSKEGPKEGKGVGHMLEVIQSYPELCASIDRIAHSSTREGRGRGSVGVNEVGVSAHDLRRETAERVELLRRCDRYEEALGVKDQMLWALLQERNRVSGLCSAEEGLRREYSEEVAHWVQLSTSLSGEVERLKEQLASVAGVRAENEALKRDKEALVAQLLQQGGGKERGGALGKGAARAKEGQAEKE